MASVSEIAEKIIAAYVDLRRSGDTVFVTYGELAQLIGREGQHRLLGAPLDRVRDICSERNLPDIATVIVDKASLDRGSVTPSAAAIEKYNGWLGLRREQARVIAFDWSQVA